MKLKKIRMVGFKSFADETVIETGDGITAVVGPNGCGKSNILDAVRWVLGEKSGKALRGKSMEDVIFLGSEYRKQSGMAEVEMVFDNRDQSLASDQIEVSVARRIYLNTGSEYLLNGRRTTRREIEKIFMDTGVGKSAYSIMEQGRMSEILRAAPEDRRALFDEAAGVSRFKSERKETMARLSGTDQNLLRLTDILKSKEGELRNLERQAEKTRTYLDLKEQLDGHDRRLRYLKHVELDGRRSKVGEKLDSLLSKRDDIFRRIAENEKLAEEKEDESSRRIEEMHRLDRDYHQALAGMDSLRKNMSRLELEKRERAGKLENLKRRSRAEEGLHKDVRKRMDQSMQLELDLNTELKTLREGSEGLDASILEARRELESSRVREEENTAELSDLEGKHEILLEELKETARNLIEELEHHKQELKRSEDRRGTLIASIGHQLEEGARLVEEALQALKSADANTAAYSLGRMELLSTHRDFLIYQELDESFRAFLFGKTGLLAKKEDLDARMDALRARRDALQNENNRIYEARKLLTADMEKQRARKVELDLQIRDSEVRKDSSVEARETIAIQLRESADRLKYYEEETQLNEKAVTDLTREAEELRARLQEMEQQNVRQTREIEEIRRQVEVARSEINGMRESSRRDREGVESILPEISEQERRAESIQVALNSLEEDLYNDFQVSPGELAEECAPLNLDRNQEDTRFRALKSEIGDLGQFNPLAIEELQRASNSYNEIQEQKADVERARENILKIVGEIDERSKELFVTTFEAIQNNFSEVFQKLFGGGNASLTLSEPHDPLNSGVDIMVQPAGKKNSSLSLLSGGEQNMTAIALMFATYLVRPSPFCFLDEIDAPLDDNNVGRFLKMLSGFAQRSQFLVITHNKLTMAQANGLFGVTQEEAGVSKLVSVQLREAHRVVGA